MLIVVSYDNISPSFWMTIFVGFASDATLVLIINLFGEIDYEQDRTDCLGNTIATSSRFSEKRDR